MPTMSAFVMDMPDVNRRFDWHVFFPTARQSNCFVAMLSHPISSHCLVSRAIISIFSEDTASRNTPQYSPLQGVGAIWISICNFTGNYARRGICSYRLDQIKWIFTRRASARHERSLPRVRPAVFRTRSLCACSPIWIMTGGTRLPS